MLSRITIEVDLENATPYIRVIDSPSDDVKDKLVSAFRQKLGYRSNWCRVDFKATGKEGIVEFHITPITQDQIESQAKEMSEIAK